MMADQRTMAELLRVPTEGYAEAIVVPPILAQQFEFKHSLINMMNSDQFFGLEKDNPHDHIRCDANSNSSSEIGKLNHAVNQQTSDVTIAMTAILKQFQATLPPASVKAIEKICITCGGAHPYYQSGISRDVFVPVVKFTFPADFIIVDYESDPRPSGNPTFSSHPALTSPEVKDDIFEPEGGNVLPEKLLDLDSTEDLHPPLHVNPLSGSTTDSSSPTYFLKEFSDELALITFPSRNDDLQFDIESDLKEIEYVLYHDPIKDIDSSLKDSIDQSYLANLNDNLVDSMPEMFIDEHALDYSSPPLFDEFDDDLFKVEPDTENFYDDPFDSKGEKIKESKLLIDELDLPCDFLLPSKYDSILSEDFPRVDALPSTNNEDKLAISNASLMLEDFDPPLYELSFFKEVPRSNKLLPFSSKNEEKVFKLGIHTSRKVHSSLIPELSHQGYKVFKINQNFKIPMKIFLFSCGKDT
uniref:Reverse transcriptase domain-containing protein n=1 Tax=Tanacetum cinerariifolium TaxID=118510 RepID=A0A6L2NJ11_TANCI|nr:reverse transcriptase domain-containing protein [Tanacetum cinerariifolium]